MSLQVKDTADHSRVPFLRGILTRSLQKAGLPFDEAYQTTREIEGKLGRKKVITTDKLSELVAEHLRENSRKAVARRYEKKKEPASRIEIFDDAENRQPFSKGTLAHGLQITGLSDEECHAVAAAIEQMLLRHRRWELTSEELAEVVFGYLEANKFVEAASRYRVWNAFSHSGRPLILLLGGTNGSGKSTLAADIAHRLNIIRTQSTDMLREVMRLLVPERLAPTVHQSSFKAWKAIPGSPKGKHPSNDTELAAGFFLQSSLVGVAVEGVVKRAEREGVSVILEGIHIHPELMAELCECEGAIIVPVVLAVLKKKRLKKQLRGRGHQVSSRRAKRYLNHFDEIWNLQAILLSESEKHGITIVHNLSQDDTIRQIMDAIIIRLASEFKTGDEEELEAA